MKSVLFLFLLLPISLLAQTSGTAVYQTKAVMEFNMEGNAAKDRQLRDMLPSERVFNHILYFDNGKSLYKPAPDNQPTEVSHSEGNAEFVVRMNVPDNQMYHDFNKNLRIERREFLGKYFVITDEPTKYEWKLTGKSKKIAGYNCQEATYSDSTQNIVAWFTPEIPVAYGPGKYGQLPGLIMAMDFDNGKRIIEITELKSDEVDKEQLEIPSKGKKVSAEEFDEIVDKKMEEMGATRGGGGIRMIITEEQN